MFLRNAGRYNQETFRSNNPEDHNLNILLYGDTENI
jgi:hypothetical protein